MPKLHLKLRHLLIGILFEYLVAMKEQEETNHVTICRFIQKSLTNIILIGCYTIR
jgi:glucose-6-phosphate-specific signal transduction histidine kinase